MLMDSDNFRSEKKKKVIGMIEVMGARGPFYARQERNIDLRCVIFENHKQKHINRSIGCTERLITSSL
jgi:hypothetical protein